MDKRAVVQILDRNLCLFFYLFLLLSGEVGEERGVGKEGGGAHWYFFFCGETARFLKREWWYECSTGSSIERRN